ncbi:hypothetical protein GCM10027570_14040 [Streptomonospora sediminis]
MDLEFVCYSAVYFTSKREPFSEVSEADWLDQFTINVHGLASTLRATLPLLRAAAPGAFLHISSEVVYNAGPQRSGYAATKAAADSLIRSLAQEIDTSIVRFIQALPEGMVDTPGIRARRTPDFDYSEYMTAESFGPLANAILRTCGKEYAGRALVVHGDSSWSDAFIGQSLGWRATFAFIAIFSGVTLVALVFLIPRNIPRPERLTLEVVKTEARELKNVSVIVAAVITVFAQAAVFASSTYIVTSLEEVTGFASSAIPILLVVFGVGAICGNFVGGRVADLYPRTGSIIAVAAVMVGSLLWWAGSFLEATAVPALFVFGATGFSIIPALQARVLAAAEYAPTLALSVNVSAFNLGNGLGALVGGLALSFFGGDATVIPLSGVALAALSLVIALIFGRLSRATVANREKLSENG